jgi:Leucine-rich repeat (LRR) protein
LEISLILSNSKLKNFSSIAELENLESLKINGDTFLYDLSPLHSLKKLKYLSLSSSSIVGYREKQRLWEQLPEIEFIDSWISWHEILDYEFGFPHE